jgi:Predicted AAA-ATPase
VCKKLYVIIDEYDSPLMNVLSKELLVNGMKSKEGEEIENQFKRFFSLLKEANKRNVVVFVTGVSPLCLTEFTSGWNHATRISDFQEFAGLYGFEQKDIVKGIQMIRPPIPDDVVQMLVKYCDCYDGYKFDHRQTERLFNPGRILYFLNNIRSNWLQTKKLEGKELFDDIIKFKEDTQTKPAESTLNYIRSSDVSRLLLQDLLKEENVSVKCVEDIDTGFTLNTLHEKRRSLITFM